MAKISMPSGKSVQSSATTYGYATATGLVYQMLSRFLGTGIIPQVITAIGAGSIIQGDHTKPIMAVLGFEMGRTINLGNFGSLGGIFNPSPAAPAAEEEI